MRKLPIFFVSLALICLNFILINQVYASTYVISGTISEPVSGTFMGTLFDESGSSVVINEFVYNPSSDNEWIELFNKTGTDINLSTWTIEDDAGHIKSLSGIIPANGIYVYENPGADFLNNTTSNGNGDIIYLKNNGTLIDQITYQRQANNTVINNTSSVPNSTSGQSLHRTSDAGITWSATSTPSKGWFNSGTSVTNVAASINGAGVTTNLGTSDIINPSSSSGLYFEKTGKGKITFSGTLNLTDNNTMSLLQDLGTKLDMNTAGRIAFDASTAALLKNAGAVLIMYGLDTAGYSGTPEIIVKDDSGNVLVPGSDSYPIISGVTFSGGNLTFSASHFSQYDAKKIRNITTGKGFDTIQSAIDDADTLTGHTINVSAGSYSETVTINKSVTLSGSGTPTVSKFILAASPVTTSGFSVSGIEVSDSGKIQDAGIFSLPSGQADLTNTPQVNIDQQVTLNISASNGTSSVILPAGINITKTDGGNIDSTLLSAVNTATSSLSGFGSGIVADGALQWGIPNLGLTFSSAITLSIFVGASLNGQTLNILRSPDTSTGWTSDGIVAPATCVVSSGVCTFQATKASYYAVAHTISSDEEASNDSPLSSAGGGGTPPTCDDAAPGGAPTLLSVTSVGANKVTLTWSEASSPVTYYLISYRSAGGQQYGNPNVGGAGTTSYTVANLSGGETYYFKVRAGNGCKPGNFSNEMSVSPSGGVATGPAAGFQEGVLGVTSEETSTPTLNPTGEIKGIVSTATNYWRLVFFGAGGLVLLFWFFNRKPV